MRDAIDKLTYQTGGFHAQMHIQLVTWTTVTCSRSQIPSYRHSAHKVDHRLKSAPFHQLPLESLSVPVEGEYHFGMGLWTDRT